jgi:hypothetical protein
VGIWTGLDWRRYLTYTTGEVVNVILWTSKSLWIGQTEIWYQSQSQNQEDSKYVKKTAYEIKVNYNTSESEKN